MSTGVVVTHAYRTAVGRSGRGSLRHTRPDELLSLLIMGFLERVPQLDPASIDDVIVGCAFPEAEQGMNVARIAVLRSGLPVTVPAMTSNRFCSSGLQSLATGAGEIIAGWSQIVLTGGVESMTMVPMGGQKPSPNPWLAENFPNAFGLESNRRALAAIREGRFKDEIIPITTTLEGKEIVFDTDDGPRESSLEAMAKLRPVFKVDGVSTAGNSSQTSDGAAIELLMTRAQAEDLGFSPLAELVTFQVVGVHPDEMGVGPAVAIPKALAAAGLEAKDIGLFELNEAFASQALYCVRQLGLDPALVNVNGGAIALGHPLGCTGAKLTASLLHEMKRRQVEYGVVSMCIGGGMGAAAVFHRG
jgi:acetyl-CoA acyltransferase